MKHMCGKCEQTVNCWIEEADKRERRAMQKELAYGNEKGKKNEKCEEKVTTPYKPTNPSDVSAHAPPYHHYPMMVFKPWTVNDMKEAMTHLPSPDEAGDKFSAELVTFCQEFSPTVHELRRLLAVKLGALSWHKVSGKLQREDCQREHSDWEHRANVEYRTAVAKLSGAIKIAFPACVDTAKIGNCCQSIQESVQDYYHRLCEIFNKHSGLIEPDDRGNQPDTWVCHLRSWFLNGLRPEIAQAVKSSYIEWKNGRLSAVLAMLCTQKNSKQRRRK